MELGASAEFSVIQLFAAVGQLFSFSETDVHTLVAVFTRVGAVVGLLPGFGERAIPTRVRLAAAIAFTAIVWPVLTPGLINEGPSTGGDGPFGDGNGVQPLSLGRLLLAEAAAGLMLGVAIRMLLWAMQFAGSIAAQATSVLQIFGSGATPDPMPAIGNLLTIAAITVALVGDLHIKASLVMIGSYEVLPLGVFPVAGDLATWGVARAAAAFGLAFSLAAPFLILGLVYNIALGAISRAMPQLMVVLIGAPAIVAISILLLMLAAPVMLTHWSGALNDTLVDPFGLPR